MPQQQPRRGRPSNAFEDYAHINGAYADAREIIISMVEGFNRKQSDGLGFWALDLPVMDYIHSCIPQHLKPAPLGASTKDIQERMRLILYPFLENKQICDREFASWVADEERMREFTNKWLLSKSPSKPRGEQKRFGLEDFIDAGLITRDTALFFRCAGKIYTGSIAANHWVHIDLGNGLEKFRSPDAVFKKGLNVSLNQWRYCFLHNDSGEEVTLGDIRNRYRKLKGIE